MTDVRQSIVDIINKVVKPSSPIGQDPDQSLLAGELDFARLCERVNGR